MDTRRDDGGHPGRVGLRLPGHLRRQPALTGPPAQPSEILERVQTARGELVLRRVGSDFEVISNGVFLMDTRDGRSEKLLVRAALDAMPDARSLLIGGLGVGFSLREAVADVTLTRIDVVEIEDAVVRWHRSHLAELTGDALADPRVAVMVQDLEDHVSSRVATYDVVCVDVDNGPTWTVTENNATLYDDRGTRALLDTLRPGGVLAVWSAMPVPDYEQRLRDLGCDITVRTVDVPRGDPDVIYLASR